MVSRRKLALTLWRNKETLSAIAVENTKHMTNYILLETALRMITNSYLLSVIALIAASYLGIMAIETIEQGGTPASKPKWFN